MESGSEFNDKVFLKLEFFISFDFKILTILHFYLIK